eukprot:CAMPEP_0117794866 /NCGR_PEP_ID=MMETSP0948-20121206/10946_1 /TAXON_ID=44440 /ORGANISM="Chattonella subsalsa, Strain CCMP2191" /LENGTH=164 /DNA_ID=CAMNT_0005625669 /DNA_START=201 /DNA_END=695 /DNA_ORIENTATION=+
MRESITKMGRGIYCSTSSKLKRTSQFSGTIVQFSPGKLLGGLFGFGGSKGIKIATEYDPFGLWRNQGYNGVYIVSSFSDGSWLAELCIRKEIVDEVFDRGHDFYCQMQENVSETEKILVKQTPTPEDQIILILKILCLTFTMNFFFRSWPLLLIIWLIAAAFID